MGSSFTVFNTFNSLCGILIVSLVVFAFWWRWRSNRYLTQLKASRHELLSGGENLRRLFESIQDYAIFSYNRDHTITSWNPGVQRVLGYEQDEFVGQKIDIIFSKEDRQSQVPQQEIQRALADSSSVTEGIRVRKNGRQFWGSGIVRPLISEHGQLEGFIKVLQDLTDRRQLEESLEQAKRAAEEANRAKDEFIAVLSHELRSPLTPISIALDGLEHEVHTDDGRMFSDMIRRNLALELRLIDDLLDVTRIARGKLAIKLENFNAHAKILETVEILKADIESPHLTLRLFLNAREHYILADSARFQQIIWNLLRNAIKFTPEHGVISIASKNDNGQLILEITDTGIGMDEETMKRIFRPFTQGMPNIARKYGGLGLGLSIARALSETFTGRLFAKSDGPGKGTTFTVELPASEAVDHSITDSAINGHAPTRQLGKLLIVDDQADVRMAFAELLKRRNYVIDAAENIVEALSLIKKNSYDLILCDIQLEGESGWDLIPQLPRLIPAIAVSALGSPSNIETSLRVGFKDHIIKPFRMNDLDTKIQEILSESRQF